MQQFDLIIVGGGLAGASLALAYATPGCGLPWWKASPRRPEGWDARIYAISPANIEFLDSIGAWRHLDAERMVPIRAMEVHGDSGGKLAFSAYETGVPELGISSNPR
jgi:2-polyprenyl-6-methoxyphenol hydroxylase-like FAD-dependent oxidoreductase